VSWLTYKSLLPGNSLIRAEQEPDPNTLDFCGLPKTDSKSSKSPCTWNKLEKNIDLP